MENEVEAMDTSTQCELFTFGLGSRGQLGISSEDNQNVPKNVSTMNGKKVVHVACGSQHSAAITDSGEVWTWGSNDHGQLGRPGRQLIPVQIEVLESVSVVDISCGENHCVAVTNLGQAMSWGLNNFGQLGMGDKESRSKPHIIKDLKDNMLRVAAGYSHSLFLSDNGEVFVCGKGGDGQIGLGDYEDRRWPVAVESLKGRPIVDVAAGESHSVALSVSGNVYSWGGNKFGQLGLGDNNSRTFPTQATFFAWGTRYRHQLRCKSHDRDIRQSLHLYFWQRLLSSTWPRK
eukprot:TRINITY_DN9039_c0_g1_i1.p1 TRINITY_DN9039_c0_g1~~TRINITY_DN9039_c0_g1_i1.p1  ORF type:complete len:305 (+),score=-0.43 TRINITY_DN9039_c0_g1_i1:49-915(+)